MANRSESSILEIPQGDTLLQSMLSKQKVEELIRVLKLPIYRRSDEDTDLIVRFTETFPFFQKYIMNPKYSNYDIHTKCCKQMTYEFHPKASTIFNQGNEGDKLYFILDGRVNSYVKMTPEEIEKQKALKESQKTNTQASLIPQKSFLNQSYGSISKSRNNSPDSLESKPSPKKIVTFRLNTCSSSDMCSLKSLKTESILAQLKTQENLDSAKKMKTLQTKEGEIFSVQRRSSTRIAFNTEIMSNSGDMVMLEHDEEDIIDDIFEKILEGKRLLGTLGPGQIFGDISLTTGSKRMATIVAMEDCHLGVLSKEDFDGLLLSLEKKKFKKRVDFFEIALGITLEWERVVTLMYMFKKEKYIKNQMIFGDNEESDGFYILKTGDVLIYKEVEFSPQQDDKGESFQNATERSMQMETPLKHKASICKKSKFPIQSLSSCNFFGEEVLLGYNTRNYAAECKSEAVTVYHITKNQIKAFTESLSDYHEQLFQKVEQRTSWRYQRLTETDKYVTMVLKASRKLQVGPTETPFLQRIFAKDIPKSYAIAKNENSRLNLSHIKDSQPDSKVLRACTVESKEKVPIKRYTFGDSFTKFQFRNKVNAETLGTFYAHDPQRNYNPFDIESGLIFDPVEEGIPSRKLKILMQNKLEQKLLKESGGKKQNPLRGCQTLREAVSRVSTKLEKVSKCSLKMVIQDSKEQEAFRERIARSISSERKNRSRSKPGLLFLKIQGLEPSIEKSSKLKTTESFVKSSASKTFKTDPGLPENLSESLRRPERTISLHNLTTGPRSSICAWESTDNTQLGGELKSEVSKVHMIKRPKREDMKVLDMISFKADFQKEKKERESPPKSVEGRDGKVDSSGNYSRNKNVKENKPYLTSLSRKGSQEIRRVQTLRPTLLLEVRRSTEGVMSEQGEEKGGEIKLSRLVEEIEEKVKEIEFNYGEERRSEGIRKKEEEKTEKEYVNVNYRPEERKKSLGEWNSKTIMTKTRHNLFRLRNRNPHHSNERESSLKMKTLL